MLANETNLSSLLREFYKKILGGGRARIPTKTLTLLDFTINAYFYLVGEGKKKHGHDSYPLLLRATFELFP